MNKDEVQVLISCIDTARAEDFLNNQEAEHLCNILLRAYKVLKTAKEREAKLVKVAISRGRDTDAANIYARAGLEELK